MPNRQQGWPRAWADCPLRRRDDADADRAHQKRGFRRPVHANLLQGIATDRSPILSETPVGSLFVHCGRGTGGFNAIPNSGRAMVKRVASGEPATPTAAFKIDRFRTGRLVDESVAAGVAH